MNVRAFGADTRLLNASLSMARTRTGIAADHAATTAAGIRVARENSMLW
jgi:hypothetical protein